MRAVVAATSTGLYCFDLDKGSGPVELYGRPVAALTALPAYVQSTQRFAGLSDDWELLGFICDKLQTARFAQPVPSHTPTCMVDIGGERWQDCVGTVGAHLFGSFDRTDAQWAAWDEAHPGEHGVPLDLIEGFEAVGERDTWTQPWGAPADMRSLAVLRPNLRAREVAVLANPHVGGLLRSDDDGRSWTQLVDPAVDVHQVAARSPGVVAVATGAAGCGISHDGGRSWTYSDRGLHAAYCRAVAFVSDTLLVSASTGPRSTDGRLYRRPIDDDTAAFEPVQGGLPLSFDANIDTHHVASRHDTADAALLSPEGTVYLSRDAARTWSVVGTAPGSPRQVIVI